MSDESNMFWQSFPSSALLEPSAYRSSAWSEHVPFAFWLIDVLRPARFVELGTWYGMSYLAFCQAISAFKTGTSAFAVDTWQGDEHTGQIAAEALASLRALHDPQYKSFSTLLQMRFNAAADLFEDSSIDLLHIDGLHTYEAVKEDFETWLPKLSNHAVVLFHDTQVRDRDFGVHRLWAELIGQYAGFEFEHEHGLGVLGVGSSLPLGIRDFFDASRDPENVRKVRQLFKHLGGSVRANQDLYDSSNELSVLKSTFSVRAASKLRRLANFEFNN